MEASNTVKKVGAYIGMAIVQYNEAVNNNDIPDPLDKQAHALYLKLVYERTIQKLVEDPKFRSIVRATAFLILEEVAKKPKEYDL